MNFSVSLHSEENVTNLLELETSEADEEPYLTLDLVENRLSLKYSNVALKSQLNDNSSFYVEISQFYDEGKVGTNNQFFFNSSETVLTLRMRWV